MWVSHSLRKASAWFPFLKKAKNNEFVLSVPMSLGLSYQKQLIDSENKITRTSHSSSEMVQKHNSNLTLKANFHKISALERSR